MVDSSSGFRLGVFDGMLLVGGLVGRLVSPKLQETFGNHGNYAVFTILQVINKREI